MLNNKIIAITGGTGALGKALTRYIFQKYPTVKKVIIFSRDEQKQYQMAQDFSSYNNQKIQFIIGDVRDLESVTRAFQEVDYVIHAAAMKHIHIAELNPDECIKTNIGGAQNVIKAALETGVKKVVSLSTDKACAPNSLYGATKLASDKLFVAANNIKSTNKVLFSVVRYGNVLGSNGSVIPLFLSKNKEGFLPITNLEMTRFNISVQGSLDIVLHTLEHSWGGEIFIPKIPSYKITDIAKAIAPECTLNVIGIRPGEKIHEEMISSSDSFCTYDLGKYYTILPTNPNWNLTEYITKFKAKLVPEGFNYNSNENTEWETVESLKSQIENLDIEK